MYDVVIVGAGPAGLTAAIYLLRANKKVLVLEKESIGGQMAMSPLIENYPGIKASSGTDIASSMYDQVIALGGNIELEEATSISNNEVVTDSNKYKTKTVIIATGAKPRGLNLANEGKFIGNGISFCVSCDGAFYKDSVVAVIGGGNSAVVNAIFLSSICKHVYVIQNLKELTASPKDIENLLNKKNVEIFYESLVTEYLGEEKITGLILKEKDKLKKLIVDGMFISIGQLPATEIFTQLEQDHGYIVSNDMTTSIKGVFVAGDCRSKKVRQITTATADGTLAALAALDYLDR